MTESALQIPHLTQTVDEWLELILFAARAFGSRRHLESREQYAEMMTGGGPGRGGAHLARVGIEWQGSLGRCRRSTSWCAVAVVLLARARRWCG